MKFVFTLICIIISIQISSQSNQLNQTIYSGFIDKYPIELVLDIFSDGDVRSVYTYNQYDEPILINGRLEKGTLTLYENESDEKNKAVLKFENFDAEKNQLKGTWKKLNSNKPLKISLTKKSDIENGEGIEYSAIEIIQPISLKDKYFKLVVSKEKEDFSAFVSGLKLFTKKTDILIQQFDLSCQLWGLNNVSVGDFNFDGIDDFSVFEQSYSGPNTTSLYFLFDPETGKFFQSSFEGTSLEFDQKTKRIYEHNQCCAGEKQMNNEYKVENNKMILLKKTCLEYDEKIEGFIEVQCE
jgi:hypothetical protein